MKNTHIAVKDLNIDLKNFRTIPQKKESDAVKAMIAIKPDKFFAVMESIIEDGFLPTENIIVLNDGKKNVVKEGNRRIAVLKLIHGYLKIKDYNLIPNSIINKVESLDSVWKRENLKVPCTIFDLSESDKADKVVNRAHGKGEKAGRDPWSSVARARHNRDINNASESGLDLLEKYLKLGSNLTNQQKERWAGDYPITVLNEMLRRFYVVFDPISSAKVAENYPKVKYLSELEAILRDIGLEQISFEDVRETKQNYSFLAHHNIIIPSPTPSSTTQAPSPTPSINASPVFSVNASSSTVNTTPNTSILSTPKPSPTIPPAHALNDPRHVKAVLKKFSPRGSNRQKVVQLNEELKKLVIKDNPFAFCFILRSMFEISAKAYCTDHSIPTQSNGKDKPLVDMLTACINHLTSNGTNVAMKKVLHGASVELTSKDRIFSVTSLNQLVHSPTFSIMPTDICGLFSNIYPLLEALN